MKEDTMTLREIFKSFIKSIFILGIFVLIAYLVKNSILNAGYKPTNIRKSDVEYVENKKDDRIKQAESVDIVYKQVSQIIFYMIIVIGLSIALIHNGIQTTTVFAMLGTIGLTVGLSLQNTVSNIWDGMDLLVQDTYRIGDLVEVKIPGINYVFAGRIVDFNLFRTKIADKTTGSEIHISNNVLHTGVITNQSTSYQ